MAEFVERCGFPNPADGSLCQLPKGHEGLHHAAFQPLQQSVDPPVATPPAMPPQPPKAKSNAGGCIGIGCASLVALFVVLLIIGSCSSRAGGGHSESPATSNSSDTGNGNPGWNHAGVASIRAASKIVGGFSSGDRVLYSKGLQHMHNAHQPVGSATIAEIVVGEKTRESDRAREVTAAHDAAVAAAQAHLMHGDPDCLVLDDRSLGTDSDEYVGYVKGVVKNTCDRDFSYVQVEIGFYSSNGTLTDSGLANINNLASGGTWAFKTISQGEGGTWKVERITGF